MKCNNFICYNYDAGWLSRCSRYCNAYPNKLKACGRRKIFNRIDKASKESEPIEAPYIGETEILLINQWKKEKSNAR